jgi:hypothetical protein
MTISQQDIDDAPEANMTHWYKCPACEHLHVVLTDEAGDILATAVLSRDMLTTMLETVDETVLQ